MIALGILSGQHIQPRSTATSFYPTFFNMYYLNILAIEILDWEMKWMQTINILTKTLLYKLSILVFHLWIYIYSHGTSWY